MCAILGYFGQEKHATEKHATTRALAGLAVMKERGKNGAGIATEKRIYHADSPAALKRPLRSERCRCVLGHLLHSVVNRVYEPLEGRHGVLVANCEIYNWKELAAKHRLKAKNDAHLLLLLLEKNEISNVISNVKSNLKKTLDELDGVYAFAYWAGNQVLLARDLLGVKPLWYSLDDGSFSFASEKKALLAMGCHDVKEQNPRTVLMYDMEKKKLSEQKLSFFSLSTFLKKKKQTMQKELQGLLTNAVAKRIPDERFGILFSGGVDSALIAVVAKALGVPFTLYTAALREKGLKEAEDLFWAKKVAKQLGMRHKTVFLSLGQVRDKLRKVVPLIEDNNVVKAGVGLAFYAACEQARKDGVRIMFSGLGSEELFAGYERHRQSSDVNKECLSGLRKMYERDLYRDDVVTMNNSIELRLPFLDRALLRYALRIPSTHKLQARGDKLIMREVAELLGVPTDVAWRKKRAAQYGSSMDKAIGKLAKKERAASKSQYLSKFLDKGNVRLGILWSSGKDSCLAMHIMHEQGYALSCLITMVSKNPDSYMFHTPAVDIAPLQARALELPLIVQETLGKKERELADLKKALARAKKEHGVEGIVTGALFSTYQRDRIEKACDAVGLKIFTPLWHMDQGQELGLLLKKKMHVVISAVAGYGFDESWICRRINSKLIDELKALHDTYKINLAGEGGEFESLVLDAPLFRKRIELVDWCVAAGDRHVAQVVIKKAVLKGNA